MTTKSMKSLYLIIKKIYGCIEESSGNKYFGLVPTDKSRETLKRFEKKIRAWSKIRDN